MKQLDKTHKLTIENFRLNKKLFLFAPLLYKSPEIMLLKQFVIIILGIIVLSTSLMAGDTIQLPANQFFRDIEKQIILSNTDCDFINTTWPGFKTHLRMPGSDSLFVFTNPVNLIEKGVGYEVMAENKRQTCSVYFTALPVVNIRTNYVIPDEPNVLAHFSIVETDHNYLESYVGIQYRGGWSQFYPKKSMEIEFWTDTTGTETVDYSLLGLTSDDDWNLNAMYNEPLRVRTMTNNELWRKINTLHYQSQEPDAINGVRMKYVELFLNGQYRGVYSLGEKVNRKQLKLKKFNGSIRGELYKATEWGGAVTYTAVTPFNNDTLFWDGFEYKHPEELTDWTNLYNFVDFVVNAPVDIFYLNYQNYVNKQSAVDYFIFLNLMRAEDNTGKNIFVAKYKANDPYFFVPWDLDGTFGIRWDGSVINITNDLLTNGLYSRLIHDCQNNGFYCTLKSKWQTLRAGPITHDSLMNMFLANNQQLIENGVYERETIAWPEFNYAAAGLEYMSEWITNRLAYLDQKFNEACVYVSLPETSQSAAIKLIPNPANDYFVVFSDKAIYNQVKIYDASNLLVAQIETAQRTEPIFIGQLKPGVYFVGLFDNGQLLGMSKLIKQ